MLLTINRNVARLRERSGFLKSPRGALRALTCVAGLAVAYNVWRVGGTESLATLLGLVGFIAVGVWGIKRHWRATAVVLFTIVALLLVVVTQSMRWAEVNPGGLPLTYLAFVVAAPLGAYVVPVNRGARWVTVGIVGGSMVACSVVAPLTPQGAMAAATLALFVPLAAQGLPRRERVEVAHGA